MTDIVREWAEDYLVGTMLEWKSPPPVRDKSYVAPSSRGCVHSHRTDYADGFITVHAVVRFAYKNPVGQLCWSDPLELTAGIPCTVWEGP